MNTYVVSFGKNCHISRTHQTWRMINMTNSDMTVEIVGEYIIVKKDDKKSVLDSEDILNLLTELTENENKVNQLAKECSELKIMMGAK